MKETSISDQIQQLWDSSKLAQSMSSVAAYLMKQFQFKLQFCSIHGKRWSHEISNAPFIPPLFRVQFNEEWGIIYEDEGLSVYIPVLQELFNLTFK